VSIEIDVQCERCGGSLTITMEGVFSGHPHFEVRPCEKCEEDVKKESHAEGKAEAEQEAADAKA